MHSIMIRVIKLYYIVEKQIRAIGVAVICKVKKDLRAAASDAVSCQPQPPNTLEILLSFAAQAILFAANSGAWWRY